MPQEILLAQTQAPLNILPSPIPPPQKSVPAPSPQVSGTSAAPTLPPKFVQPVPPPKLATMATQVAPVEAPHAGAATYFDFALWALILLAIGLIAIIVLVRVLAARVNDASPDFPDGTRRRFGLPPGNLFEYHKGIGWRRIRERTRHGPLYDERPHIARVQEEHESNRARRFPLIAKIIIVGAAVGIVQYNISPRPLFALFNVTTFDAAWENAKAVYLLIAHMLVGPIVWAITQAGIPFDSAGWMNLGIGLVVFVLAFLFLTYPVVAVFELIPLLGREIVYLLGIQWIRGARVFDASPELLARTTNPAAPIQPHVQVRAKSINE